MKYSITFMSTGGLTVEADSEDEAREKFENEMEDAAVAELAMNGINITEIAEDEDK